MTDSTITPFGSIELAMKAFLISRYQPLIDLDPAAADALVGRDFAFDPAAEAGYYFRVEKAFVSAGRFEADFTVDLETWGTGYLGTESRANAVDALLLGYPHVVEAGDLTWVFDTVSQNTGPRDLPWEDDTVTRMGATYVITARRR